MKKLIATLLIELALLVGALNLPQRVALHDMSNDCAIYATEAYARLHDTAPWCRILFIHGIIYDQLGGHAMTVWQITKGGNVYVYDFSGTLRLRTHSHNIKEIVKELEKADHFLIFNAFYAE